MDSKLDKGRLRSAGAAIVFSLAVFPAMARGMTTQELAEALGKAHLPEATVVSELPGTVEEQSPDFLGGASYVKVTLDDESHPHVLKFVHQGAKWVRIAQGPEGWKKLASAVDLRVKTPEAALRYVQWALDATSGAAFWRLDSVADVPFEPAGDAEADLKSRLASSRSTLAGKIQAPKSEAQGAVFRVQQDAVVGRDLVRYTIDVSKLGSISVATETLERNLPVVQVGRG